MTPARSSSWLLLLSLPAALVHGHGTMMTPLPRQPESVYWYQVGCMIGCECSGGGKEDYPSPESLGCLAPEIPSLANNHEVLTFNAHGTSPRGSWNALMPWRKPGSSIPIDSCGIASGFLPSATVQFPHKFDDESIVQGLKGTDLPPGPLTQWEAGSVVDVSFYLNVNHGGGYQYRVCPSTDGQVIDEACFEQNPLAFADTVHTVVHNDKEIEIPATDVSEGVIPEGHAWRKIPIPACNCDSGGGCSLATAKDFDASYDGTSEAYGKCATGLQFIPPHIADGTWPEGYGYYVARLTSVAATTDGKSMATASKSPCEFHSDEGVCLEDKANSCKWYTEKNECYESRGVDDASEGEATKAEYCTSHTDEATCLASTESGEACTWYDSPTKAVCYYAGQDYTKAGSTGGGKDDTASKGETKNVGEWHITDRVYAPTAPGNYILQWRWDNEQTPQIWTTCADIEVIPQGQTPKPPPKEETGSKPSKTENTTTESNSSGGFSSISSHSVVASILLALVGCFVSSA